MSFFLRVVLLIVLLLREGLIGAIEKIGAACVVHLTENTVHLSVQESGAEGVDVYAELQQVSHGKMGSCDFCFVFKREDEDGGGWGRLMLRTSLVQGHYALKMAGR